MEARAAEALVFASRQAIGLVHTPRGLRVLLPLLMRSFCNTQVLIVPVDWASRRSNAMDGTTRTKLKKNMKLT